MKLTDEQKAEIKRQSSLDLGTEAAEALMEAIEAHEKKQQAIEDGLELPEIDYFGGCPKCTLNDGCLNIERSHWYICHKHKTKWWVPTYSRHGGMSRKRNGRKTLSFLWTTARSSHSIHQSTLSHPMDLWS